MQWLALDSKAQGAAVVAGAFLAGVLGFVRTSSGAGLWTVERFALSVAVGLIIVCIVFALLALRMRDVDEMCARDFIKGADEILFSQGGLSPERVHDFNRDQANQWLKTIDDVKAAVDSKASYLERAQTFLFFAVLCAAGVALLKIWEGTCV